VKHARLGESVNTLWLWVPITMMMGEQTAVRILFLDPDGMVCETSPWDGIRKISATEGGFTGKLDNDDRFGISIASLQDRDGDGVTDIAVGSWLDDDGGSDRGAVWLIDLQEDGMVKAHHKISQTMGGFGGVLDDCDGFGCGIAGLSDLDDDGVNELAGGASFDDDGGA